MNTNESIVMQGGRSGGLRTGFAELIDALRHPHLWALLAWYDIRQRYRRSVLGPFWVTISTGIMIGTMGVLWSVLFKMKIGDYLPFFTVGNIIWTFYSAQINEASTGFTQFESVIKQIRFPMPIYLLRILVRNFIIMLHNAVIIIAVISILGPSWSWNVVWMIPGLFVGCLAMLGISLIVSVFCTRFRDMPMIIQNTTMVLFYVTPIIWKPHVLGGKYTWILEFNPLAHLIEVVRAPLLGETASLQSWMWAIGTALLTCLVGLTLQGRFRRRIAYWL